MKKAAKKRKKTGEKTSVGVKKLTASTARAGAAGKKTSVGAKKLTASTARAGAAGKKTSMGGKNTISRSTQQSKNDAPELRQSAGRAKKQNALGKSCSSKRNPLINACPEIKRFRLDEIKPADYNPRVMRADALAGLAESLQRFGCVEPIIVNTRRNRNVIVGGNQRYAVLKKAGVSECLCVTVSCSVAEEKTLNLALNNPEIQGQFIRQLDDYIRQLQTEISDDKLLVDLRIDQLDGDLHIGELTGNIPDDEPVKAQRKRTRPGDLWLLGEHRLLCGDSTNPADVERLMDSQQAGLFATDPPYCVDYTGNDRPKAGKDWSKVYHEVEIPSLQEFMRKFYEAGLPHIKPNTALYLWHASSRIVDIHKVAAELGLLVHQQIVWVKPCVVLTYSFYSWRHEPCLLMWQKGNKPPFNPKKKLIGTIWPLGYVRNGDPETPEYYTDVWELDWTGHKRNPGFDHPTVKPVEVFAIPMRVHTKPGEICYEPFCGSGSQIIAAEKLQRRCYALELEPHFCDVAVERWEKWTGKKARKVVKRHR